MIPFLGVLAVWQLAALAAASPLLPSPWLVAQVLAFETLHGPLPGHLAVTLARTFACFALALVLGGALGAAMGFWPRLNRWLDPWLQLLLAVPAMVVAILAYVWMGLSEPAAIVAVTIAKIPGMAVVLREGTRGRDRELWDMARVFHFPRAALLRHVLIPELAPYLLAATRSGLAMVWKIVLLVELLGRSSGIGFQLHVSFQMMNVTQILAYSLSFMAVMVALELGVLRVLDRHVARHR